MTDVETDLRTLRNTSSTVALAMVFLSGAIGWISTVGLMRPITRARDAAIEMQKGDLTTRLPEAGTGEVAELARSFNSMAETLQATLASLTEAEAGQRRFVADVSHELRTPLTALSAAVDVMEQNIGDMPPPAARAAQLIIGESRRLRTLVEDLMEISRFDSGKLNMDKRMIDVGDAVRSMLTARGWMGVVQTEIPLQTMVFADRRRFDTIMGNLVMNALVHGKPPVVVRARTSPEGLEATVQDDGPGIPWDQRDLVFERFYKGDPARSGSDGSGLGLSIARENASAHGGDLSVRDGGKGTCFVLRIPAAPAREVNAQV